MKIFEFHDELGLDCRLIIKKKQCSPEVPIIHEKYIIWVTKHWAAKCFGTLHFSNDIELLENGFPETKGTGKRFHGNVGIVNNISTYIYGIRKCLSVDFKHFKDKTIYTFHFGADLVPVRK